MTTMDVITNRKKKSKPSETEKNETKEKRKRKRNSEIRADGDSELQQTSENDGPSVVNDSSDKLHASNNNNTTRSEKETKKKKKKKDKKTKKSKKKKENKKSKEKETESDTESKSEREHESESNHHDERTNGGSAAIEDSGSGNGNGNGRLVASSAIEFYDDDLKKKAKKRQKLATKASETETETKTKTKAIASIASTSKADENAAGLEEALRKQRSKAKKKKRNRSDSNDNMNNNKNNSNNNNNNNNMNNNKNNSNNHTNEEHLDKLRQRDELDKVLIPEKKRDHSLTLLLFYQYIEPEWDDETHERMLRDLQRIGTSLELTGRMRCAREGLNCTLTGRHSDVLEYTRALRQLRPNDFCDTEFKLTTDLPLAQKFGELKVLPVVEIVRYGLEGQKAPPIRQYSGVHLEPRDYHKKLAESNTVVIDVRNHYEAAIGRFVPPTTGEAQKQKQAQAQEHEQQANADHGPKWIDPKMRKSTEFPAWLDKDETKEMMKGKQVLMYCTGGIRCERASALLKYKMETDPSVKDLGIKGVFQLQGGIDKYFKEFPDGGYWKGKNYVFDKRFAHAPPKIDGELHGRATAAAAASDKNDKNAATTNNNSNHTKTTNVASATASAHVMGKCEACHKPWDMYRGKRRCPTCGVPSLICKDCFLADKEGRKKLTREVRCDLCVEQGIFSKRQYRETDERFIREYESKMTAKGLLLPNAVAAAAAAATTHANRVAASATADAAPNPKGITRLVLKNMCRKRMNEDALLKALPAVTHVSWNTQRNHRTKKKNSGAEGAGEPIFTGMGWVEMATPEDAARAVALNNKLTIFGRTIGIAFQAPDGKDVWPPPNSRVA